MQPKKLKRMIYIYEENLEFYDSLDNKSQFMNDMIFKAKKTAPVVDSNIEHVRRSIAAIDKLSAK